MSPSKTIDRSFALPPLGDNPSTDRQGTTPGSFANKGRVGTPYTYSSPDTPGMPAPSDKTAWDFLPAGAQTAARRPVVKKGQGVMVVFSSMTLVASISGPSWPSSASAFICRT